MAMPGFFSKEPGVEDLLFLGAKNKISSTTGTTDYLILKTHQMTSSFFTFQLESGHPIL
jgi:hypothetical protein